MSTGRSWVLRLFSRKFINTFLNGIYFKFRKEAKPLLALRSDAENLHLVSISEFENIYFFLIHEVGKLCPQKCRILSTEHPSLCERCLKTRKTPISSLLRWFFRDKRLLRKQQLYKNVFWISVLRTIKHANHQVTVVRRRDLRHRHQRRQVQRNHP